MTAALSIRQIEQQLKAKLRQLKTLQAQRKKVAASLAKIDTGIAALTGKPAAAPKPKKAKAPKAAPKRKPRAKKAAKAPKKAPARTRKGQESLTEFIKKALAGVAGGMRVQDIAAAVQKLGYKTTAKNFYGIVAATLRGDDFQRLSRGVYALKGQAAPAKKAPAKAATKPAKAKPAKKKAAKPAKKAVRKAKKARKAAKTPGGLHGLLIKVLTGKESMSVGDAMEAVLASGYKTKSQAFRGIVNQTLIKGDQFKQVGRGKYALK